MSLICIEACLLNLTFYKGSHSKGAKRIAYCVRFLWCDCLFSRTVEHNKMYVGDCLNTGFCRIFDVPMVLFFWTFRQFSEQQWPQDPVPLVGLLCHLWVFHPIKWRLYLLRVNWMVPCDRVRMINGSETGVESYQPITLLRATSWQNKQYCIY